jgi:hypothetical protein
MIEICRQEKDGRKATIYKVIDQVTPFESYFLLRMSSGSKMEMKLSEGDTELVRLCDAVDMASRFVQLGEWP